MLQMMINYVYRMRNFEHLEMRCRTIAAHELAIKSKVVTTACKQKTAKVH